MATAVAAATALVAAAAGLAMAGPAGASTGTPEVFAGSASGTAFTLNVAGMPTSAGDSSAQATSTFTAKGRGIGSLSPLGDFADQTASVSGSNNSVSKPQMCANPPLPTLPSPLPKLTLDLACSTAKASTNLDTPTAMATGTVVGTTADVHSLLSMVIMPNSAPAMALQSALGQVGSVAKAIPVAGAPLNTILSQVLNSALTTQTLGIKIGGTTSSVVTTAGTVTSEATATGAEVDLLAVAGGQPLVKIVVGSADSKASYLRATGKATPTVNPSIVTVTVAGQPPITVSTGQAPVTILSGTPLESTITPAAGTTTTNPDGSVSATAAGAGLDLLKGIGGGINLQLASTTAAVGGTPAKAGPLASPPTTAPPTVTPRSTLPFTGEAPWIPFAGLGALGLAFGTRRALTKLR